MVVDGNRVGGDASTQCSSVFLKSQSPSMILKRRQESESRQLFTTGVEFGHGVDEGMFRGGQLFMLSHTDKLFV